MSQSWWFELEGDSNIKGDFSIFQKVAFEFESVRVHEGREAGKKWCSLKGLYYLCYVFP